MHENQDHLSHECTYERSYKNAVLFLGNNYHVGDDRRGNQKWPVQRNWQPRAHKTKKHKPKHNTICVGHQHAQANTNNLNKT